MKDRFKIRFRYYKSNEPVVGISYKVNFIDKMSKLYTLDVGYFYKEHEGKLTNPKGETVEFTAPSDHGVVNIFVKGKSSKYKNWTLVSSEHWDERNDDYKLKTVPSSALRELEIELPLINTKVETKKKKVMEIIRAIFIKLKVEILY